MKKLAIVAGAILLAGYSAAYSQTQQQIPTGDTAVSVSASTSTLIWTNTGSSSPGRAARVLRIVPNTTTCNLQCDGSAVATATSTPIPGGYVFNLSEPPPITSCYAYCTSATSIAVSQGN